MGFVAVCCVVAEAVASSSGPARFAVLCPLFSASGVGAGVGPCVFGCGLVLLPSLALFVGLHLDLGLCCAWSGKKNNILLTLAAPPHVESVESRRGQLIN